MTYSAFNLWCVHTASCWWGMQCHCIPHQQLAVCAHHCVHTILNCTLQMAQFPFTYDVHNYSADIAVLQLHCVLPLQRSYIFAELSLCSKFPTVKALFLFMAGASVAACVTVLVHLKTKESMRVCTTVCYIRKKDQVVPAWWSLAETELYLDLSVVSMCNIICSS